jgi:hypothetical protein
LDLSALDPFTVARQRITANFGAGRDGDFMKNECDRLSQRYGELEFVLSAGVIHGDASVGNVIRDDQGRALLSDLDGFATGPREWDLVLTAMYFERYVVPTPAFGLAGASTAYTRKVLSTLRDTGQALSEMS